MVAFNPEEKLPVGVRAAYRFVALRGRIDGTLGRGQYRKFGRLLRENPTAPDLDGVRFTDLLTTAVMDEALAAGVARMTPEGPVIDSLMELIKLLIENAPAILEIIIALIALFA